MLIIYCLGCKQHVDQDRSGLIFKTGFHKSVPLGVCKSCMFERKVVLPTP